MAIEDIDFEGNDVVNNNDNNNTDGGNNNNNNDDVTNLNHNDNPDITHKDNTNQDNNNNNNNNNNDNNDEDLLFDLKEGEEVEVGNVVYKVDKDGNLVDKDGIIMQRCDKADQFLKDNGVTEDNSKDDIGIIDQLKEQFGDIVDEQGKSVDFTEDAEGILSYVNSYIEKTNKSISDGAINKLFKENPELQNFIDYVTVNGSSEGYGSYFDRSSIVLDKENQAQQESIIKMAAQQFNNPTLNDNYIAFLKNTGGLYDEAKRQLEALVNYDNDRKQQIAEQAEEQRQAYEERRRNDIRIITDAINAKRVGEYLLPDTITREVDGKKMTYTLQDFVNYMTVPNYRDDEGNTYTKYQVDCINTEEQKSIQDLLLSGWLKFTGGSYKDLVNMAIKETTVRRLVAKNKEKNSPRRIKVNNSKNNGGSAEDVVFE